VLEEISSGAQFAFTIEAGQIADVPVWNLIYDGFVLYVTEFACNADEDSTEIIVDYQDDVRATGRDCRQVEADFEIWLYGDPNDSFTYHTPAEGEFWLFLPDTDGSPHRNHWLELLDGAFGIFGTSLQGGHAVTQTVTIFVNSAEHNPHPTPTVTPTATVPTPPSTRTVTPVPPIGSSTTIPRTGAVTTLPSTGNGNPDSNAWFLLGMAMVGMAGLAGIALRRKPSYRER
jgi:hypothetical protein